MRKLLLTTCLIFIGVLAFSQSLELYYNDEILDKDTIYVEDVDGEYTAHMSVKNISNADVDIFAKVNVIQLIDGTALSFCLGECYNITELGEFTTRDMHVVVKPNEFTSSDDAHDTYFPVGHVGTSIVRYTYYNSTDVNDSVSVVVKYTYTGTGFYEENIINSLYPNPANDYLNIDYTFNVSDVYAEVYSLIGNRITSFNLDNSTNQKRINTTSLPNGIYYIRFSSEGRSISTKRFIVNHY